MCANAGVCAMCAAVYRCWSALIAIGILSEVEFGASAWKTERKEMEMEKKDDKWNRPREIYVCFIHDTSINIIHVRYQ